jgi:hypothetical protein
MGPVGPVAPAFSLRTLIWLCRFRMAFQILWTSHCLRLLGTVTSAADAGTTIIAIRMSAMKTVRIFRVIFSYSLQQLIAGTKDLPVHRK